MNTTLIPLFAKRLYLFFAFFLVSVFSANASDYYWVGGSGNWSDFASHWATSSGGSSFHTQVPQSTDNVIFDANSFSTSAQTVTLDISTAVCNNINWTGVSNLPTFNGNNKTLKVYGSLTLVPGMTISANSLSMSFESTTIGKTITTAGKSMQNLSLNGIGGGWTLQDALTLSGAVSINNGAFSTNNQTVSADIFTYSGGGTKSLTLGSSIINLSNGNVPWEFRGVSGLTLSAGTSTINLTSPGGAHFGGGNQIYNDVVFANPSGFNRLLDSDTYRNLTCPGTNTTFYTSSTITNNFICAGTLTANGSINIAGTATISGSSVRLNQNNSFGTLNLNGPAGSTYTFGAGKTQTITNALNISSGSCSGLINLNSSSAGSEASISLASGSVAVDYVNLKDIKVQGGASFNATNVINLGNNTGWTISGLSSKNLYWVGGTGNWSDGSHWALTSGGTAGGCSPTLLDNVFFDANSFSTSAQTVTLDISTAVCNNINWTGVSNMPTFNGNNKTLKVYGSLTLVPGMTISANSLSMSFEATTIGKTITTAGKSMQNLSLNGIGGGWTLQDALTLSGAVSINNGAFNTNNQTVSADIFTYSGGGTKSLTLGSSIINLSNGNVPWEFRGVSGLTLSAGTSTINLTSPGGAHFGGGNQVYNDVVFADPSGFNRLLDSDTYRNLTCPGNNTTFYSSSTITNNFICAGTLIANGNINIAGTATISGNSVTLNQNNSFGTLNLNGPAGSTYTLGAGTTQTITNALNISSGSCIGLINLNSSSSGSEATISLASGSVAVDYVNLKDIKVQGGASFNATNVINLGNNTGWTISGITSKNLYWVGGTGNWSDGGHWALTSGGTAGGCSPTLLDNVIFDANSFSTSGQTVTLDISTAVCNNIDWTGVANMPTFNGNNNTLKVYGSLTLVPGMTISPNSLSMSFEATTIGKTITTAGKSMQNLSLNGIGGGWTLQDALTVNSTVSINNGAFSTNNQTVSADVFTYSGGGTKSLTLGSSIINLSNGNVPWEFRGVSGLTLSAGTSTINLTSPGGAHFGGGNQIYNDVVFAEPSGFNSLLDSDTYRNLTCPGTNTTFHSSSTITNNFICAGTLTANGNINIAGTATISGNSVTLNQNNSFGTLNLNGPAGSTYTFGAGKTQTITNSLSITGATGGSPAFLQSSSIGTQATISMASGSICTDYIRTTDINVTGGATFTAGPSSQNVSNSTGWTFISGVPNPTISITANTGTTTCLGNPVTFTAAYTNGGLSRTFQWFVNGVSVQNSSSATYVASNLSDGAAVYCVISALPTSCSFSLVVNSNTLNMTLNDVTPSVNIGASATTIASGTSVTFTATPTNGGTPAYKWQKNGINVGTNSATYIDETLANNDVVTCIMTSSVTCLTTPTVTSNSVTMTVTGPPSVQASSVSFSNITATTATVSWTNGNGGARSVFIQAGASGSPSPVNNTTYTAGTVLGSGTQIGSSGWYCVYNGTGTSVNITGLTSGTTYQAMSVEYNGGVGNELYLTTTVPGNPNNTSGINSISKTGSSPNNASSVPYTVTFGQSVTGLTTGNFSLTTTGSLNGASVSSITGSGSSYILTVNTGSGDGTVTLNLANSSGLLPGMTMALPFAGDRYTIDKTAPEVSSINRVGSTPNGASSDQFTVTFSESVTGVDVSDFSLSTTGTVGGTISSLSAVSGSVYTVTVNTVTGDGTMRLDLNSSGTGITDLAANAIQGGFSVGQVYSIDHTGPVVSSVLVPANATYTLGQNLDFTVNFDKSVSVNTGGGVPSLAISLTGGTVNANYLSGSGSTTLIFRYSVALGDVDLNGITVDNLSLNGGTLKDGAGNNATLSLNSIGDTNAVMVDGGSIITTSVATLTGFSACAGASSAEQSFTVSGNNLKNNVVVSAAEGFEVSKTTGIGFGPSVSITASGTLAATTVYVRTTADASGSVSGNISLSSTNAETKIISASGSVAVISPIEGGNSSVNVTVQAIGGGGGANGDWGASGGGGGAAIRTLSLASGDVVNITVGSGGNSGIGWSGIAGGNGEDSKAIFNSINIIGGGGKGAGFGMAGGIATGGTINLIGGAGRNPGVREPGFDGQKQDGYSAAGGGAGNFEDGVNTIINLGGLGGGLAGNGGHGSPQYPISSNGQPGFNYGGGGGGGGNYNGYGGAGGQGVVAITYPGRPIASGGTITQSGGNTTHTFSTSGTDIFKVLRLNSAAVGIGSNLQLSNATAGGTWSSSDTGIATISNTGLVSGLALGTATLTYTVISNGCSNKATIELEVTPLPTISTSDAARAVCSSAASQTTTLNYSGVTGSPIRYSITWNAMPTNSFVAVTDNALSGTPINITVPANTNPGTYTGTITVKNANGSVSDGSTFTLTVTPLPTLTISGTTSISVGSSTTLTASGANTYSWSIGGSKATPLDSTAQSNLAVGLRKLISSYTGSAVRLRRSTDNVEQDFGFFGSDLDLASIATFLGGVNGYVTKLYDQSGNGNDLIQANNSLQPLFVANGLNGKPILRITADTHERLYNNTNFTPPYTVIYTGKQTGTTRNRLLDGVNNNWLLGWWAGSKGAAYYEGWVNYSNGASDSDAYVYTGTSDGNTSEIYENGTLLTSNSGGLAGPNGISMGSSGEFSDADFTELFIFNSVVSTKDRQLVENSSGGYYGFINPAITTGSITVSPTTNTVYTLVGTNAIGCSTSITQLVTVDGNAANTASAASVTPTVCINTALTAITHATTGATGIGTTTGLPAGVTAAWESNTVTVSGTPLESGVFSYSIPLTGGYGSVSATGTITVTPEPEVTQPANQVVCNDSSTTLVTFTGSVVNTTYIWTNNTASIGLASSGTGNIDSFTATNTTNAPIVATITVTPSTSTSGVAVSCTGASKTFTITVNPTFTAGAASTTPTLYTNTALTPITHTTTGATGIGTAIGLPAGLTADWASNTITISGTPTASGTFNYSIPLTGDCGIVSATGTITALESNNANLSLLALNSGTISPSFAAGITSYTATVSHVTESIKVTPTVDYATATVTVNGTSVTSGSASEAIMLSVGSNNISILVTAPDGTTTKTYTVSVTRLKEDPLNKDTDGDGVTDAQEAIDGTDPNDPCSFKLASQTEVTSTAWNNGDCNGDGLTNQEEKTGIDDPSTPVNPNGKITDPLNKDTDGDGVTDAQEAIDGTDPTDPCTFKLASQTELTSTAWNNGDCNGDGLTNQEEKTGIDDPSTPANPNGKITDPLEKDTDGDGVTDAQEAIDGTDPTDPCSFKLASQTEVTSTAWNNGDCDGDGVSNEQEKVDGTNPNDPCSFKLASQTMPTSSGWNNADCDGDGVTNGKENADGTNPNDACSFKIASQTLTANTAWNNADCDVDGVTNSKEKTDGTDPNDICSFKIASQTLTANTAWNNADCDGDGVTNAKEKTDGTDPNDICSFKLASQTVTTSTAWNNGDCDGDGLTNQEEKTGIDNPSTPANPAGKITDPMNKDTDGDSVSDAQEAIDGTNPNDLCSFKLASQTMPTSTAWNNADCDGDGVTNGKEKADSTNPNDACSFKIASQTLTANTAWNNADCDGDGVTNAKEKTDGTDPNDICSFKLASQTVTTSTAWNNADCDGDGLTNQEEKTGIDNPSTPANPAGKITDPMNKDTDGDGVSDAQEAIDGTNPNDACSFKLASQTLTPSAAWNNGDCDGDGVSNGKEKSDGTNPLDPCSLKVSSISLPQSDAWKNGDCDGDGLKNEVDGIEDCDKDGTPNFLDPESCKIDIVMANVFTPNGDGINDEIKPVLLGIDKFVCFKVYNRWGNLIFESKDRERGWNGSSKTEGQGTETFQWLAEGYDRDGKLVKRTGMITLLR